MLKKENFRGLKKKIPWVHMNEEKSSCMLQVCYRLASKQRYEAQLSKRILNLKKEKKYIFSETMGTWHMAQTKQVREKMPLP